MYYRHRFTCVPPFVWGVLGANWISTDPTLPLGFSLTVEHVAGTWKWFLAVVEFGRGSFVADLVGKPERWPRQVANDGLDAALQIIATYSGHAAMRLRRAWGMR